MSQVRHNTISNSIEMVSAIVDVDHDYCSKQAHRVNVSEAHTPNNINEWQDVSRPKRKMILENSVNDQKKYCTAIATNPTPTLPLSNTFSVLSESTEMTEQIIDDPRNSDSEESSVPKPPPIFVPDVSDINKMVSFIDSIISKSEYTYKCLNLNKVRISPLSPDAYRKLVRLLKDNEISFYTYQFKQDKSYRAVLKNMHFSTDLKDLKDSIEEYGHKVRNITNIRHFKTKNPLPIFFIDLEPSSNNKDIFNIEFLLNAKISFEPPHKKKEIVQCKKCQNYGHTKTYCFQAYRCVKCGGEHDTTKCSKLLTIPPTCALCNGEHPANYKGCSVYRDMKMKTFPSPRPRTTTNETPAVKIVAKAPTTTNKVNPSLSYADATRPKQPSPPEEDVNSLSQTMKQFIDRFEKLMYQQSQQIGTLMNLLTTVISKLK